MLDNDDLLRARAQSELVEAHGEEAAGWALATWKRMSQIGLACGVADCRPHRLRDTFAVELLKKGTLLEDVSQLLGHSDVRVTQKYYSFWSLGRKRSLEDRLFQTLVKAQGD